MNGKRILQIVVSVVLLAVLARWVDVPAVGAAFASADPGLLAVCLGLAVLDRLLMAWKWNLLLLARGLEIGWGRAARVYWVSTFVGLFLPPTVGGDAVRGWMVARRESRLPDVVSSILAERFLGLVALALWGVAAAALYPAIVGGGGADTGRIVAVAVGLAAGSVAALAFSFTPACARLVEETAARLAGVPLLGKASRGGAKVYASFRGYRDHPGTLWAFFALTVLEGALPVVRAWLVAVAFGAPVAAAYFFVIVPLELLLIRIPVSFDGFGIREGLFAWFLAKAGVPESQGFAIGLANHVLFLLALLPGAVWHLAGDRAPAPAAPGGRE